MPASSYQYKALLGKIRGTYFPFLSQILCQDQDCAVVVADGYLHVGSERKRSELKI